MVVMIPGFPTHIYLAAVRLTLKEYFFIEIAFQEV